MKTAWAITKRINPVEDGACLQGYWQSEKYFQDIKSDLKRVFVPRQEGADDVGTVDKDTRNPCGFMSDRETTI